MGPTTTTTASSTTVAELKRLKNGVIGNPLAKARLTSDEDFMRTLVDCIALSEPVEVRTEAAHIFASLSYGSQAALFALLRANVPRALVGAIYSSPLSDPLSLKAAYARALRALVSSIADVVGPSEYGLRPETSSRIRLETKDALNYVFQLDTLDTLLPLLLSSSTQITTPIVQLIASATRSPLHRSILTSWLPIDERRKEQGKARKRGWEKISSPIGPSAGASGPGSSWVVRVLVALLARSRDVRQQEASLLALAALAKENPLVAVGLARESWYQPDVICWTLFSSPLPSVCCAFILLIYATVIGPPLVLIQSLAKSRNLEVQLAASLCATHIVRASNSTPNSNNFIYAHSSYAQIPIDDMSIRAVLNMVNRIATQGSGEQVEKRVKACYILYHLTTDDRALCQLAFDKGCLDTLAGIVKGTTPVDPVEGWDENEAEGTARLREASLTAIATLALFSNGIRRAVTDTHGLLPYINTALKQGTTGISTPTSTSTSSSPGGTRTHKGMIMPGTATTRPTADGDSSGTRTSRNWNAAGVRYAGCQCVRVLARAVAVLRTNIVDSGLGMEVFRIVVRGAAGMADPTIANRTSRDRVRKGGGEEPMAVNEEGGEQQNDDSDGEDAGGMQGGEDRRVLNAALAAVCNIVMEFSPLRPIYLEQGLMPRLVQILCSGDVALRLNALWAVKNLLWKTTTETKRDVMSQLGWGRLFDLMHDSDLGIQEQAYQIIRNLAESEEGIEMVFAQMGGDAVLDSITEAISLEGPLAIPSTPISPTSPTSALPLTSGIPPASAPTTVAASLQERTPTITQAVHALANICNAPHHLTVTILDKPRLLMNLRTCLAECGSEVRRGAVGCVLALARQHPRGRKALVEAGVVGTLRRLCEWVPTSSSGAGASGSGSAPGVMPTTVNTALGGGDSATRASPFWAVYPDHTGGGTAGSSARPSRSPLRSMSVSSPVSNTTVGGSGSAANWTATGPAGSGSQGATGRPGSSWYVNPSSPPFGYRRLDTTSLHEEPRPSNTASSLAAYAYAYPDHPTEMRPPVSATMLAAITAPGLPPPPPSTVHPSLLQAHAPDGGGAPSAPTQSATGAAGVPPAFQGPSIANLLSSDPTLMSAMGLMTAEQQRQYREWQILQRIYSQQQQQQAQVRQNPAGMTVAAPMVTISSTVTEPSGPSFGAAADSAFGAVGRTGGGMNNPALDVDKEVYDNARRALDWLEHGDGYGV